MCFSENNRSMNMVLVSRVSRTLCFASSPFKFKVGHISGKANVLANCLSRQYEDLSGEATFPRLVLGHLPEAFQYIKERQKKDTFCNNMHQKVVQGDPTVRCSKLFNGALVYHPLRAHA
jgi:hypothetical protein